MFKSQVTKACHLSPSVLDKDRTAGRYSFLMAEVLESPFTWRHKLFLSAGVPLFCLAILEVVCRAFGLPSVSNGKPIQLEMPTWMLQDDNAARKMAGLSASPETVDWLKIFVAGDGYRVHLIPNIDRRITNTFSLIKADRTKKYLVQSNSLGFRGPEMSFRKPEGTFRVLVFGDSSSFGWGVDQDQTFSNLLKGRLQKAIGRPVEIGNFAIPGDSSAYGRLIFEKFAPQFDYDFAILGFGANDAKRVITSHTSQVERFRSKQGLLSAMHLLTESALVRTLQVSLSPSQKASTTAAKKVPAVTERDFSINLKAMIDTARSSDDRQVLLLSLCTPNNYARRARLTARQTGALFFNGQKHLVSDVPAIEHGKRYPEIVQEMRQEYAQDLRANRLYYVTSDGCHPNKLGHAIIADELTRRIAASVLESHH